MKAKEIRLEFPEGTPSFQIPGVLPAGQGRAERLPEELN